jgi:hypothetical protein
MMKFQTIIRGAACGVILGGALLAAGAQNAANAQARDPFAKPALSKKYMKSPTGVPVPVTPPTIAERIAAYRSQKMNAMRSGVAAPKPTTILLLSEMEVVGIFRTPRGYAAMVEATPLSTSAGGSGGGSKLSYTIYPGETFYDCQLIAIEESRLVFRKFVKWTNGKTERVVENKNLRLPNAVTDGLQASRAAQPEDSKAVSSASGAKP